MLLTGGAELRLGDSSENMKNSYEILGIDPFEMLGVTESTYDCIVTSKYRKLAARLHPDKPGGSHHKFLKLQEAYHFVMRNIIITIK